MALNFDFFRFLNWSWLNWVFFVILALAYVFLILGSSDLKKKGFKSTKLLFVAGLFLLIWLVVYNFLIPTVSGVSPSDMERFIGFLYSLFLMTGIIHVITHLILSIGIVKLGRNNRDPGGIIALLGGIIYLIAWIIYLILIILQKYGGWYDPAFLGSIAPITEIVVWIFYILVILATVLILIYSFLTKRPLFILFAVLFIAAYLLDFLSSIGVI